MCLIIYTPTGTIPKKHIKSALMYNPDGWGYIFIDSNKKAVVRRGLKPSTFWKSWQRDRTEREGVNLLFHSRIFTHGDYTVSNCHPFRVGRRRQWVMHNGIITSHSDEKSSKSDTRLFTEDIIEGLPRTWLDDPVLLELVSGYIGSSKLAFMNGQGEVDIINDNLGIWIGEMWYSNATYLPYVAPQVAVQGAMGFKPHSAASSEVRVAPGWSDEYGDESKYFDSEFIEENLPATIQGSKVG